MKCAKYMKIWFEMNEVLNLRCVKNVRIRSYSGPHFPAFGLNTEQNTDQNNSEYGHVLHSLNVPGNFQPK